MPKKEYPIIRDGDRIDWVPFPQALRNLGERFQSTPDEIAIWVFLGEGAGVQTSPFLGALSHTNMHP